MDLINGYTSTNLGPNETRIPFYSGKQPRDISNPTTPDGTPIPAAWAADVTAELVATIIAAGLTPQAGALQLPLAVQALAGTSPLAIANTAQNNPLLFEPVTDAMGVPLGFMFPQ